MNVADAHGRRAEVQAAFLEGWRKQHVLGRHISSDREAWLQSSAYGRLAYGVFPPCPKCRCQLVNPHKGNPPPCMKCGTIRTSPTEQAPARGAESMENMIVDRIIAHPLEQLGDGRDVFPDRRDYPHRRSPYD